MFGFSNNKSVVFNIFSDYFTKQIVYVYLYYWCCFPWGYGTVPLTLSSKIQRVFVRLQIFSTFNWQDPNDKLHSTKLMNLIFPLSVTDKIHSRRNQFCTTNIGVSLILLLWQGKMNHHKSLNVPYVTLITFLFFSIYFLYSTIRRNRTQIIFLDVFLVRL